jgi:hypothetical protein
VDNIRMDLGEVGWGDVDWIGLAQDRNRWRALVNSVLNLRVPLNAGKLSSGLTSSGLSSSAQLHRVSLVIIMSLEPFVGSSPLFQFLNPIHSRQDSLDGRPARRKASATHRITQTHTDIHASSATRTH